jgi:hypothetical protein
MKPGVLAPKRDGSLGRGLRTACWSLLLLLLLLLTVLLHPASTGLGVLGPNTPAPYALLSVLDLGVYLQAESDLTAADKGEGVSRPRDLRKEYFAGDRLAMPVEGTLECFLVHGRLVCMLVLLRLRSLRFRLGMQLLPLVLLQVCPPCLALLPLVALLVVYHHTNMKRMSVPNRSMISMAQLRGSERRRFAWRRVGCWKGG